MQNRNHAWFLTLLRKLYEVVNIYVQDFFGYLLVVFKVNFLSRFNKRHRLVKKIREMSILWQSFITNIGFCRFITD